MTTWIGTSLRGAALVLILLPATAQAGLISFTTTFGGDGVGTFVYDDTTMGFTSLVLDFSAVDSSLSNVQLTPIGGVPNFGPGGADGPRLFDALTNPASNVFVALFPASELDADLILAIAGGGAGGGSAGSSCFTPNASGGGYAFCSAGLQVDGSGGPFVTRIEGGNVPEPSALLMVGSGLLGTVLFRRRRRKG